MKKLLVINASGRVTRSHTRRLTNQFVEAWRTEHAGGVAIQRDVGMEPPPAVNEAWIAAAFAEPQARTDAMREALQLSDALIGEMKEADAIIIGAPIYNFGMPAPLKAYFDQVVRVGQTFAFDPDAPEPYRPLLESKPVVVAVAAGDGSLFPGGELAHLNFLEPHIRTVLGFIGLVDVSFVRVGYDEYGDERMKQSMVAAEAAMDLLLKRSIA